MVSKCTMIHNIVKPIMLEPSIISIIKQVNQASIYKFNGNPIYIYIYMYVCIIFSMVRSHVHLRITMTARRSLHFTWVGVALTNAANVVLHTHRKQIKEKVERKREARQNE